MTNERIADNFDQIADLLEFQGANPFRVRAYRKGARVIRDLPESVTAIHASADQPLTNIEGIGKDLAEKMATLIETGEIPQLTQLRAEIPADVLTLLRIPGLGPKKAAIIHRELGLSTIDALQAACEAGTVKSLPGFGAKTEQTILAGIALAGVVEKRLLWADANKIVEALRQHLVEGGGIEQLEFAGSYRRGKESVGDLDVLVVGADSQQVMDRFGEFADVEQIIVRGQTKMSVRLASGFQIDLRVVPDESFGAALQYFTGSKDHNVIVRGLAKQKGLKINEYGVYRVDGGKETYLMGKTEEEVYAALDLPYFPPELREARQEFEWAEEGELPQLIEANDLRGDLHMHTTASDGKGTLSEMVEAARGRGYKYIASTDHSQRVSMAGGLDPKRLRAQWKAIDTLNKQLGNRFCVLKGIECDILERGGMDLPDDVLAEADWVLASVHYGQRQPREQITDRILGALENPWVTAIAHPTGRLINRRQAYDVDLNAIFRAAKENGKLLELNASPHRLDLHDVHCAAAKSHGVKIVVDTDAHSVKGLDAMRYGILQGRRAGLTKADVANTRTLKQFRKLIGR